VTTTATRPESAMYFGFECGDGWFDIIDDLCADHRQVKAGAMPPLAATQVKKKSAYLRVLHSRPFQS
jgi:hypothetical protein